MSGKPSIQLHLESEIVKPCCVIYKWVCCFHFIGTLFFISNTRKPAAPPVQSFAMTEENQQIKSPQEPPADQAVPPLPSKYKEKSFFDVLLFVRIKYHHVILAITIEGRDPKILFHRGLEGS